MSDAREASMRATQVRPGLMGGEARPVCVAREASVSSAAARTGLAGGEANKENP